MKRDIKTALIVMVMAAALFPQGVFAIGEYNGAWIGTVLQDGEPYNDFLIIYQESSDSLFIDDQCFGSIRLVKSGNNWILPAPIYIEDCTDLHISVWYNSITLSFQSQSYLTGSSTGTVVGQGNYATTFSFSKQSCQTLSNGVAVQNLSGVPDSYTCFQVDLPMGTPALSVATGGGTGDCDLEVIYSRPAFDYYYSVGFDTNEYVSIPSPESGTWHVFLYGYEPYSGVTLVVNYQTIPIPEFDIKANGSDGPVGLLSQDTLNIAVAVNNNGRSDYSDWWLAASTPLGLYFYTFSGWTANLQPTYQGPLFNLPSFPVLNMSASLLPAGTYTFFFGVDTVMDGNITMGNAFYDFVQVNVVN